MERAVFALLALVLLMTLDADVVSGLCQRDQKSLLLQLRGSLEIDTIFSTKLVSWNQNDDCCNWAGVSCDEVGHVTGLDLSHESISGGIENSSGLFSLSCLRSLNLSQNYFNTTLPSSLANLTKLLHLNLSNAGFVGQIPIEISKIKSLITLDLSSDSYYVRNFLTLENPNLATLVQNLKQLRELHLDCVNMSVSSKEWCQALSSSLPNLQVLSLSYCHLTGPIHPSLVMLQSLSVIRLDYNDLYATIPEFFANFSKLTALSLSSCQLNGTVPERLLQVSTLEILDLSYNDLLQGSLPEFGENISMQIMRLSSTRLSGTLPQSLGRLWNLSIIELRNCSFSGPISSSIAILTQLVRLDFSNNTFNGSIPSLQKSQKLNYVDFSHNRFSGEILSSHWKGLLNLVYVNLRNNLFHGSIPSSLFAIPSLQQIQLSENQFDGQVPEIQNASFSSLNTLELQSNKLEGSIPRSIFDIKGLNVLLLSSNKFNGTIKLDQIWKQGNLTVLDLSYNSLTVDVKSINSMTSSSSSKFGFLGLASCNLSVFPDLRNQSSMISLDLSNNKITGTVPRWIWEVGNGSLLLLNLSQNLLTDLEQPYSIPSLSVLDLHSNQLHGKIPPLPPSALFVDYSSNKFTSIPQEVDLSYVIFFSVSNNSLTGAVPKSICNALHLQVLDLSNNKLNGTIPECLIEMCHNELTVLNLRRNNFTGSISEKFRGSCKLKTLDLNGNQLEGKVPKFLNKCTALEVLDLGNNQINDVFPCLLRSIPSLSVLVLRKNRFVGNIKCPKTNTSWTKLQIVDLAFNNFNGIIPYKFLSTWDAMKGNANDVYDQLRFQLFFEGLYYQDSVIVTNKGLQMHLVKILTIFTSIDFSSNYFEGPIPDVMGEFKGLHVLNLSHNALNGSILSSLGNLSQLESLDLSNNNLTGVIPQELASLTFLSFLNLSYNNLVGIIPTSTQLQSFPSTSFEGNAGLCGLPLSETCQDPNVLRPVNHSYKTDFSRRDIILSAEMGFIFGLAITIGPILFCKRWRLWYYGKVDQYLFKICPRLKEASIIRRRRGRRIHGPRN